MLQVSRWISCERGVRLLAPSRHGQDYIAGAALTPVISIAAYTGVQQPVGRCLQTSDYFKLLPLFKLAPHRERPRRLESVISTPFLVVNNTCARKYVGNPRVKSHGYNCLNSRSRRPLHSYHGSLHGSIERPEKDTSPSPGTHRDIQYAPSALLAKDPQHPHLYLALRPIRTCPATKPPLNSHGGHDAVPYEGYNHS
jgi:hypothetical protein